MHANTLLCASRMLRREIYLSTHSACTTYTHKHSVKFYSGPSYCLSLVLYILSVENLCKCIHISYLMYIPSRGTCVYVLIEGFACMFSNIIYVCEPHLLHIFYLQARVCMQIPMLYLCSLLLSDTNSSTV